MVLCDTPEVSNVPQHIVSIKSVCFFFFENLFTVVFLWCFSMLFVSVLLLSPHFEQVILS